MGTGRRIREESGKMMLDIAQKVDYGIALTGFACGMEEKRQKWER